MRFKKIRKRDGRIEEFKAEKITNAIAKAGAATGEFDREVAKKLTIKVLSLAEEVIKSDIPTVEEIQDIVEEVLLTSPYKKTAKAYIIYRDQHAKIREIVERADVSLVDQYLQKLDWQVRENSNMTFSLQGLNNYISSQISRIYWLNKIYPPEVKRAHVEGDFHIHDLNLLAVYTYYGKEVVVAKVDEQIKLLSFEQLYEIVDAKEELLNERDAAFAKYPRNVFVLDRGGFVRVKRIVKKRKDRRMRFIKNRGGRSVIVTDDHPMITEKGEKIASEVVVNEDKTFTVDIKSLLKDEKLFYKKEIDLLEEIRRRRKRGGWGRNCLCGHQIYFNGVPIEEVGETSEDGILHTRTFTIRRKIALSEEFGYFVGFALAEGCIHMDENRSWCISISQKEREKLLEVNRVLLNLGISGCLECREDAYKRARGYELIIRNPFLRFLFDEVFKIKCGSRHKTLPIDILQYNKDFIKGVIGGLLDGDGTIETSKTVISLRISSRTLLEQLSIVLSLLGWTPRDRKPEGQGSVREFRGRKIVQNYPIYGVSFRKTEGELPSDKYKSAKISAKAWHDERKNEWHKVINNEETEIPDDFIYDVTTESGTLVVNGMWNHNCVGWDLYDLLLRGFGGVPGKIESRPARHFRSALGQVVNYFYTLQGECYSADTQVLTEDGWKYFYELSEEHKIFTLNIETQKIELQKPIRFYEFNYQGELYNFKSKKLDLLVTPNHNMIVSQYAPHSKSYQRKFVKAKDFNPNTHFIPKGGIWEGKHQKEFVLPAIQIKQYRHFANSYETVHIKAKRIDMKDWLAFFGFWLAEGSTYLRKRNRRRRGKKAFYGYLVRISQNKGKIAREFEALLKRLPFNFYKKERGRKVEFVIQNKQLFSYLSQFGKAGEKYIPKEIKSLDREYLRILFHWLVKGDGYEGNGNLDYYTKSKKLADDVQEIALKLGWNANIYEKRKGSSKWYRVAISKTKHFKFREIKKVKYQGKVYCVEVPNHTLYVRRNGKACWCGNSAGAQAFSNFDTLLSPFIRYDNLSERDVEQALQEFVFNINVPTRVGFQTPFTNITLDVNVPTTFADMPVVIGGEPRSETYADFQDEMDMFNRAFLKVLLEGDAKGRVFTFPIPTYNITKDFRWDDECIELLWEVTAKYGIPYFSNFINSDMRPEDARSMCFPGYTKVIYKDGKRGQCRRTTIRRLVENWHPEKEFYLLMNGEWVKITKSFKLKNSSGKIIVVTLRNGEIIKMTPDHPAMIVENGKLKQVFAKDLKVGDMIPIAKRGYEGELGDFELGRFLGLYIAEGGISKNTVYFSFNANETELQKFVKEVAEKRFAFPVRITKDPRWNAVQVWVKSKSAVEWIRKFCSGDAASEKRILAPCYGMSREFRLGVLVGIFQGDGYERDLELNIINKRLRDDIADLARSVGINYTKRTNPNNRKGKKVFTSYVLRLCRDSLNELLPYFKNIKASTSSIYEDFGDFYGVKIKSIKVQNYHAPVYDFKVDSKEHLFQLANGVITHNCCRLRLDLKKLERRGGGLFGASPMTGSIGVVTINMPRLGYLSSDESEFFERLERLMMLAKESLEIKRKVLERFTDADLYPYSKYYLKGIKERFGEYWKNHFSTIGLVGMNEACINLLGENIASVEGRKFTLKVLDFMREKLVEFQEETGNLYNLEATPAEGCSYRLALLDKERFPDIICANEEEYKKGAEPFYTNSSQLPVNYTDDVFEALELQEEIQTKYTGGTVFHVYVGEEITDYGVVKRLVRKICENFRIPYFTITPTFSICPAHGYIAGRHEKCPHCGRDCEVYSRVVGYLRPVSQWNAGKQEEFKMRKTFKIV
ncbi:MAG: anaerobic ribonucleoside-triphosphate reductase [Candidatus Methanospirare jalkutatii]|nr:MAG: anaerobic ribonucleoside-triphosphate reductase [Candidatus Methanospirare jalkutatii]UYZ40786.1 MAG: anaerobic ribonucleoside-triphosphate reductase [Candidatus Methanospirare jalkutatii]